MTPDGHPDNKELKIIEKWDCRDVFELIDFIKARWYWSGWGFIEIWSKHRILKVDVLILKMSTGGWSGNESLINALLSNNAFKSLFYTDWRRGGHHTFQIIPEVVGWKVVAEFAKEKGISKQRIHSIKTDFDWLDKGPKLLIRDKISTTTK